MATRILPPADLQRMALRVAKVRGRAKHEHALVLADAMDQADWKGDRIWTGRRGPVERFRVISLEAWGNRKDGWDVNSWHTAGRMAVRPLEMLYNVRRYRDRYLAGQRTTPANYGQSEVPLTHIIRTSYDSGPVIRATLARDWLKPGVRFSVNDYGGMDGLLEVTHARTHEPLYNLEPA